jgi:hypothetical protein
MLISIGTQILLGLTFASLYCNRFTREAFLQLWTEFLDAVRRVTGQSLKLQPFDPDGSLRVILLDGEAAQAQGLGDYLTRVYGAGIADIDARDPLVIVQFCLKTCSIHYDR